jgi:molecular chaperone GrpE
MFGRKNPNSNDPGQPEPRDGSEDGGCGDSCGCSGAGGDAGEAGVGGGAEGAADSGASALERLRAERDELNDKYLRALAEFQNYQRRAFNNEKEARQQGVSSVLNSILPVMDHFDMALTLDPAKASAQQVIDGVKVIRAELLRALQSAGVGVINPGSNDEFDPGQHQAIMQQPAAGVEPGHIVSTFQPGYTLGERVVRPAKVVVAP